MNCEQTGFQAESEVRHEQSLVEEVQVDGGIGANKSACDGEHLPGEDLLFAYSQDNALWERLYRFLTPLVRNWAYHSGVSAWKGQEYDVAEDILQMALYKIVKYLDHARRYSIPIYSLEHLSSVVAKNCFLDVRRRDRRLQRMADDDVESTLPDRWFDPAQEAEERIYHEELLRISARIIATFSPKIRHAILADLANHTSVAEKTPTFLQRAFLDVGIVLQMYRGPLPVDKVARSNQAALRSLAYKCLAREIKMIESGEIEFDVSLIRENAELADLAFHLQRTKHFVATSAVKERLLLRLFADNGPGLSEQEALLPLLDYEPTRREEAESAYEEELEEAETDQEEAGESGEPDMPEVRLDPELAMLAQLLRQEVMPVHIDPAFKEQLRHKLVVMLSQQPSIT